MSTYEFDMGTGEILVVYAQWEPDPKIIEAKMIEMANAFNDWVVPMQEAKEIMIRSTRRRFSEENDPSGTPWQPLNDDYWHDKVEVGGFPDQILVRTDAMRTAATSETAWFVTQNEVLFNVTGLPGDKKGRRYGAAHQAGARTGKGALLPQRAFIGPDDQATLEIEAVFMKHLDDTVIDHWDDPLPPSEPEVVEVVYGVNIHGEAPIIGYLPSGQPRLAGGKFGRKL